MSRGAWGAGALIGLLALGAAGGFGNNGSPDSNTTSTIQATALAAQEATATAVAAEVATSVALTATANGGSGSGGGDSGSGDANSKVVVHTLASAGSLPSNFFSPYRDISFGPTLQAVNQSTGQKYFTLAFIAGNGCNAEWAGTISLSQTSTYLPDLDNDINAIRGSGGDVTISFGGSAGQELAQTCTDAGSLQAQYQAVIDKYKVKHLDFDIEGGAQGDTASYDRRNTALAALQAANSGLTISFTLPSATTGLLSDSMGLLNNALSHGVNFGIVNLMTMDYGGTNSNMGQAAIDAANGLYGELKGMFPNKSPAQLWSMVGITPMIGQNDAQGEILSTDNAQQILTFAQQNKIGELSFWEISRDNGSCAGQATASPKCSGVAQGDYAFTNIFKAF